MGSEEKQQPSLCLAEGHAPLGYEQVAFRVSAEELGFATTEEVQGNGGWFGQERALAALEMGLKIRHAAYNIYVCGLTGAHRKQALAEILERFSAGQPTPGDRVLVQNFQNRDRPRALYLPAEWGSRLRQDMQELVEECRRVLPETFRKETFEEEKERISEQFGEQGEAVNRQLAERAEKAGFALRPGPGGDIVFLPLKEGRPMEPAELEALSEEQTADLRRRQREVAREVKAVLRQHRALMRRLSREVKAAERRVAADVVKPLVDELKERYDHEGVREYLSEVEAHILDNLSAFREGGGASEQPAVPFLFGQMGGGEEPFLDYEVNLLVDNHGRQGPPISVEASPTYKNLFGAVERMVDRSGKLVTNFTRVMGGSLLRAHGGCIIIDLFDALSEPLVYRALKQCLKTGKLEIEAYDPFALFTTSALKPEPMEIDTRVILVGPGEIFQMLYSLDEDFGEIFKIRADFGFESDTGDAARQNFVAHVARLVREENLRPFAADAVARLMEFGARLVGQRKKLPSQWTDLGDLMREASYWADREQKAQVGADDVDRAVEDRTFRQNRVEAKIRELIRDGVILVDVEGRRQGQVNGLAVLDVGGYMFGRPSRITATVSMGGNGVVAVDREAKLTGRTYDKAVFIITGYLRHTYAQKFPLSLSASLSFEQSYTGIEGDSASAAEIFALVSSLSGIPLRQDLAVTGSVNQFGQIQPIGGVNEKIEGFFYVCREIGLTGQQGVVIPVQNLENVVLCQDVLDAVKDGEFHIYTIGTIDEGIELLTGVQAGSVDEEQTVHWLASERLRSLARGLRRFGAPRRAGEGTASSGGKDAS